MPCVFCIAVVTATVGSLTASAVDALADRLAGVAAEPVERTADTGTVARLETAMATEKGSTPVVVTAYKHHGRVRIQLPSHDLDRAEAERLQERIAEACLLRIVDRSSPDSEASVRAQLDDAEPHREPPAADPQRQRHRER